VSALRSRLGHECSAAEFCPWSVVSGDCKEGSLIFLLWDAS
jgi:hypothetical protein